MTLIKNMKKQSTRPKPNQILQTAEHPDGQNKFTHTLTQARTHAPTHARTLNASVSLLFDQWSTHNEHRLYNTMDLHMYKSLYNTEKTDSHSDPVYKSLYNTD